MKSRVVGNLGDVKTGREIGLKPLGSRFAWLACIRCGKERWVRLLGESPIYLYCHSCTQTEVWNRHRLGKREEPMSKEAKQIKSLEYRVDVLEKNFLKLIKGMSGWA